MKQIYEGFSGRSFGFIYIDPPGGGGWLTPSDSRINAGFTNMSFEKKGTMLGNIMGYVDKTI